MRGLLSLILAIPLAVGCGGGHEEKLKAPAHADADADVHTDDDADVEDDQTYEAEDLKTAFEVTARVPFEHIYEFQVLGEGFFQRCDDIPEGLTIDGGGDSIDQNIHFSGILAEGIYALSLQIDDHQDGPSWVRTLEVTITAVAPDEQDGDI